MNDKATNIFVFKTNIRYKKHISAVRSRIEAEPQIIKWNVDLHDIDKILRIESLDLQPAIVEDLVRKAGYYCEELKD
ncbi:MAG: hypothetical protein ABIO55_13730 [Ginsengibacter sp.]